MLSIAHPYRVYGRLARGAVTGASLLVLTNTLFAQTATPPAPAPSAPQAAATPTDKPDATAAAAAAKSAADRAAFFDARVAAVHAGLQLTPDQEKLWPPVDTAIHDLAGVMRTERDKRRDETRPANPVEALQRMSERTYARGTALKHLSDAVTPLYASLTGDQKDRLPRLMRGMRMGMSERMGMDEHRGTGEHMGRDFGRGDDERGGMNPRVGMDRDRRGDGDRGQGRYGNNEDGRDWRGGREARGGSFGDERAEGRSSGDFGGFDGGHHRRDDRDRRDRYEDD